MDEMQGGILGSVAAQKSPPSSGAGVATQGFTEGDGGDAQPNVSPEEQAEYDLFVKNGMEALYTEDGKPQPEVLNRLARGKKPAESLAQTLVWLVMITEKSAEQNGKKIDGEILMHAAKELMEQLADLSQAAKLHDFTDAEIEGAWYSALDLYREANTDTGDGQGRINPQGLAQQFQELNEADKEGRADEVLPGFSNISSQLSARAAQQEPEAEQVEQEGQPNA